MNNQRYTIKAKMVNAKYHSECDNSWLSDYGYNPESIQITGKWTFEANGIEGDSIECNVIRLHCECGHKWYETVQSEYGCAFFPCTCGIVVEISDLTEFEQPVWTIPTDKTVELIGY